MDIISVDYNRITGKIKPMHAVNNGPLKFRNDQTRHNQKSFKAAGIPYVRTHDASFCASYGGEHTVDVHAVFPDFSADPYDTASYDFHLTDEYMELIKNSGAEIFYRLGSKIEHESKKYGTLPPSDFKKWAVICEHIIRHMNEGWANGHHYNIRYWEIWNEPDLDPDNSPNKRCWGGTKAEFFAFYKTAALHLKECFPNLMIGGPALAYDLQWGEDFLKFMSGQTPRVPIDFFSWHIYSVCPEQIIDRSVQIRKLLEKYGYTESESILNEWNYVRGWGDAYIYSIKTIISMKGAAFTASAMLSAQNAPIDMLMYYDARPCVLNGMWDFYTMEPLKGYYPFLMFSELYNLGNAAVVDNAVKDIKAVAAVSEAGQAVMLSYYSDDDESTEVKEFELALSGMTSDKVIIEVLDLEHTMTKSEAVTTNGRIKLTMMKNSVVLIKNH